jgi:hypothetical protein
MLVCQAEPRPPLARSDAALAGYLVDLAAAGSDCRRKLGAVADLLTDQ